MFVHLIIQFLESKLFTTNIFCLLVLEDNIMKKKFRLEGLDCASCASKIETDISKIDGVKSVSINFFTQSLLIDIEEEKFDYIIKAIKKTVRKIEPKAVLRKA